MLIDFPSTARPIIPANSSLRTTSRYYRAPREEKINSPGF
jgi:hypothetical protein